MPRIIGAELPIMTVQPTIEHVLRSSHPTGRWRHLTLQEQTKGDPERTSSGTRCVTLFQALMVRTDGHLGTDRFLADQIGRNR